MKNINKIIIHCTATPEGRAHTVKDVDEWHKQRGFSGIGYHYLIGLNGEVWEGRPLHLSGAHTLNQNANSIGIAYVGGMDKGMKNPKDTRTEAQKEALLKLLKMLNQRFPATQKQIYGHRNFAAKACPSFDAKTEYSNI
jgi:N-acetylmuramoyl-L-alanine amidase